MYVTRKVEII